MLSETIPSAGPPSFPSALRYIENGDALNTGNHLIQTQDTAQALGHLKQTKADLAGGTFTGPVVMSDLTMSGLTNVKTASRSVPRYQSMVGGTTSANWSLFASKLGWRNTAQGGTMTILLDRLPHGNILDSVTVKFIGAAGHGALPSPMPSIQVGILLGGAALSGTIGSPATDPSASVAAYEVVHDITAGSLGHTIDLTAGRYFVEITGEGATNFVAGAEVTNVRVSCTVTSYTEY